MIIISCLHWLWRRWDNPLHQYSIFLTFSFTIILWWLMLWFLGTACIKRSTSVLFSCWNAPLIHSTSQSLMRFGVEANSCLMADSCKLVHFQCISRNACYISMQISLLQTWIKWSNQAVKGQLLDLGRYFCWGTLLFSHSAPFAHVTGVLCLFFSQCKSGQSQRVNNELLLRSPRLLESFSSFERSNAMPQEEPQNWISGSGW